MAIRMKRKYIRWGIAVMASPFLLFMLVGVLIYLPPVQKYLVKTATEYASEAMGLQLSVGRLSLRFPLDLVVSQTVVADKADTLLCADELTVKVRFLPLLKKKVEVDGLALQGASVNTYGWLEGIRLEGELGYFFLSSHSVELAPSTAVINEAVLQNTRLQVCMADTAAADTTQSGPVFWKFDIHKVHLSDVDFRLSLPLDTMELGLQVHEAALAEATVDLHEAVYTARSFRVEDGSATFDTGTLPPLEKGLDPSHIALTDIQIALDSLYYAGNTIRADIRTFTLKERSGLEVVSTSGRLLSDEKAIRLPSLQLKTPGSVVELNASMDWDATDGQKTGEVNARLMAEIGKEDLARMVPGLPDEFWRHYPSQPLRLTAGLDGDTRHLRLSTLSLSLPTAFRLSVQGDMEYPLDSLRRKGKLTLLAENQDSRFLQSLTGGVVLPAGLRLDGDLHLHGARIGTLLRMGKDSLEQVRLEAGYQMQEEAYQADLTVQALDLHDYLPDDSLFTVSASLKAEGKGLDFFSPKTEAKLDGRIDHFLYGKKVYSGMSFSAGLAQSKGQAALYVTDNLMDITAKLEAELHRRMVKADLQVQADRIDFYGMGLTAKPLQMAQQLQVHLETDMAESHRMRMDMTGIRLTTEKKTFRTKDLHVGFRSRPDSMRCYVNAGDLVFLFRTPNGPTRLGRQMTRVTEEMNRQWKAKRMDQQVIKGLLPETEFRMFSKEDNPLANVLAARAGVRFKQVDVKMRTSPQEGLNADAFLYHLRTDSLELDTLYLAAHQDSVRLNISSGVKALTKPWQEAFNVSLDGFIGAAEAQLIAEYRNGRNEQGAYIGVNAHLREKGISLHVFPDEPTLVYRKFHTNQDNYFYWSDEGRMYADLKIYDGRGTGIGVYHTPDSTVQQDLTLALHRLDIAEFRRIVPYMPDVAGWVSAETHYVQQADQSTVAAVMNIDQLAYNKYALGDWEMNAVYLPQEGGTHTVDGFLMRNGHQIAALNGSYLSEADRDGNDRLTGFLELEHFPLEVANAFVPDRMATLTGDMDGTLSVDGPTARPVMNGDLALDSVTVLVPQASLDFRMDNRSVYIKDSRLRFDSFNIYTKGKNPFTIDGDVNLTDMTNPRVNLKMTAHGFELINAKKTKGAMVHGKLNVDFFSTLKGDLEQLTMRGNMNVLGSSNFTYVMQDSPLAVEDRLGETVTFVNFADTTSAPRRELPTLTLGGVDVLMTLHIDEAVQARVDLNASGSNYMLLEGGGDLSFQYKPDGDMLLNGRYSLISGEMKYEMPIIPLKTFHIKEGSYIEWTGNMMNPNMNIKAFERMRASVAEEGQSSRMVNFDVGVNLTNRLENLGFTFTLEAPDDGSVQNQLAAMSGEEKNKLAVTMVVTGMYMAEGNTSGSGGFNTNSMLNSFLQGQINNIAGSALKTIDVNFGMETNEQQDGSSSTDYNFQFAKRFWNNRFRVVIGGKISSGNNVQQDDSFIDNISLEYRLDNSGTRYIKVFHNKNYESVLDGEVIETGAGIVLRKKVSKLSELFIFRKRKNNLIETERKDHEK